MRSLPVVLALIPGALWAEDFAVPSTVSNVVLYPQGATITREVTFKIPQGQHQLVLTDLPRATPLERVRVEVSGAAMGSVTARNDYLPPIDPDQSSVIQEAEAEIERIEARIETYNSDIRLIRTEATAAQAKVAFLQQLGSGDGVAALGVDALRELSSMVGDQTLDALRAAHEADERVKAVEDSIMESEEELQDARKTLAALMPKREDDRALLSVAVSAESETEGMATITYTVEEAGWTPVYDVRLTRETAALTIERGAFINQYTGENWTDVALTLSTVRPSEQTDPGEVWPWLRRIYEPEEVQSKSLMRAQTEADVFAGAVVEEVAEAPMKIDQASASIDGLSVTYTYPKPVSVSTDADRVRIALGTLETKADITAQAVPLSDQTAFLMAEFQNDSGELILPTWEAMFYLDGRFVGQRGVELIPSDGEAKLSFGPIEGLRLKRVVADRREGDRGVISKSNEIIEEARLTVENLTGETWPLRVLDRVPYSEQEDLVIDWRASPMPSEQTVDDKRGVMAWEFDLEAGQTKTIDLTHTIEWPEGQMLR